MQSTTTPNTSAIAGRLAAIRVGSAHQYLAERTAQARDELTGMVRFHHLPHDRQRALCFHEAGHVVADLDLGIPFTSVSVQPKASEGALGIVRMGAKSRRPRTDKEAITECYALLAGGVAEELATGTRNVAAESDDLRDAHRAVLAVSSNATTDQRVRFLEELRPAVKALLTERWPQVTAVATALLGQGHLDEEEAYRIAESAALCANTARVCADTKAYLAVRRAR